MASDVAVKRDFGGIAGMLPAGNEVVGRSRDGWRHSAEWGDIVMAS
jgi:hypothetical protein